MKADSGASKHFVTSDDKNILTNVQMTNNTPVLLPNKEQLNSNIKGHLPLSKTLNATATQAHILPGIKIHDSCR